MTYGQQQQPGPVGRLAKKLDTLLFAPAALRPDGAGVGANLPELVEDNTRAVRENTEAKRENTEATRELLAYLRRRNGDD